MANYIAVIHKDQDSSFGVSFPDFPGCISAGASLEEARVMAQEALELHIEGMIADGDALPEPSDLDAVQMDPSAEGAAAFFVVEPKVMVSPKVLRLNITMPEDLVQRMDARAEALGQTRSGFLANAVRHELSAATGR